MEAPHDLPQTTFNKTSKVRLPPARYCRLRFNVASGSSKMPLANENLFDVLPEELELEPILPGAPRRVVAKTRQCIYCGALTRRPNSTQACTDEHIVPEAIGGQIIIDHASCDACADLINSYEGDLLSRLFWLPRNKIGLKGKKRARGNRSSLVNAVVNGQEVATVLPIEDNPSFLTLPFFYRPNILELPDGLRLGSFGIWVHQFEDIEKLQRHGVGEFATPPLDTLRFAQLLAKIAHGYAISQMGFSWHPDEAGPTIGGYQSVLLPLIRKRFSRKDIFGSYLDYVGGFPGNYAPSSSLHDLGAGFLLHEGQDYLVVWLRLFASFGAPIYWIIVGCRQAKEPS
jgi:hypothetical protein